MEFVGKTGSYRLVKMRDFKTKTGSTMWFATLADTQTYENADFVLERDADLSQIEVGKDYQATIIVDGKYTSLRLTPLEPLKK